MAKVIKLKQNMDFRRLYYRGKSYAYPALVVYIMKNRAGCCRIGITSSKKIGCAVDRNRARRVICAAYSNLCGSITGNFDFVFVARAKTTQVKSTEVERYMRKALSEHGCIRSTQGKDKEGEI